MLADIWSKMAKIRVITAGNRVIPPLMTEAVRPDITPPMPKMSEAGCELWMRVRVRVFTWVGRFAFCVVR